MAAVTEPAPAKLNLALHVRNRRQDGYHALETLFAFARHGDVVTVEAAEEASLTITGPFGQALARDTSGDNLVTRAAGGFRAACGTEQRHRITLEKNLPIASGIGGGSADAAATLRALCRLHGVAVNDARVTALARSLGADVPACLVGRATFGAGRGDELSAVAGLGDAPALLVNPGVAVSTAAVFAGWDGVDRGGIRKGGTLARALAGRNDLEPPARAVAPVIDEVVALLAAQPGVVLARMSGSGATCFAIFADGQARDAADEAVARHAPTWWRLATSVA